MTGGPLSGGNEQFLVTILFIFAGMNFGKWTADTTKRGRCSLSNAMRLPQIYRLTIFKHLSIKCGIITLLVFCIWCLDKKRIARSGFKTSD
jgi:hypothetical protein